MSVADGQGTVVLLNDDTYGSDVPGDQFASALDLSPQTGTLVEVSGNIGDGYFGLADVDLYRFDLAESQTVTIDIDAMQLDDGTQLSNLDSYLRVFDSNGLELQSNDHQFSPNDYGSSASSYSGYGWASALTAF